MSTKNDFKMEYSEPNQHWSLYSLGYKEAIDSLEGRMSDAFYKKLLVYPYLFLTRHYVELCLKEFIVGDSILNDRQLNIPTIHKLDKLWIDVKALMQDSIDNAEITRIDKFVASLCALDITSQETRYPFTLDGREALSNLTDAVVEELTASRREFSNFIEPFLGVLEKRINEKRSV